MCFVHTSAQAATFTFYGINRLVLYNGGGVYLLRGTDWVIWNRHVSSVMRVCILRFKGGPMKNGKENPRALCNGYALGEGGCVFRNINHVNCYDVNWSITRNIYLQLRAVRRRQAPLFVVYRHRCFYTGAELWHTEAIAGLSAVERAESSMVLKQDIIRCMSGHSIY